MKIEQSDNNFQKFEQKNFGARLNQISNNVYSYLLPLDTFLFLFYNRSKLQKNENVLTVLHSLSVCRIQFQ